MASTAGRIDRDKVDVFFTFKGVLCVRTGLVYFFGEDVVVELLSGLRDVFLDGLIIEPSSDINYVSDATILDLAKELKEHNI